MDSTALRDLLISWASINSGSDHFAALDAGGPQHGHQGELAVAEHDRRHAQIFAELALELLHPGITDYPAGLPVLLQARTDFPQNWG